MRQATLLLEGGAARGLFTTGVLDYLLEKNCMVSDVIGLSAGASNALGYVAKQKGWAKNCMIHKDHSFHYCNLQSYIRTKSFIDMELMFDKIPNELVPFHYDAFFQSDVTLTVGITNCITGQAEYRSHVESSEELLQLCRASCSLPLLSTIVEIDSIPYLDGAVANPLPIEYAQSLGTDKIIVVLTRNFGYRKNPTSKAMLKVIARTYKEYPQLIHTLSENYQCYNKNLAYLEQLEQSGKIFVLRPHMKLYGRLEQNPDKLEALYHHGYHCMEEEYQNLMAYLEH